MSFLEASLLLLIIALAAAGAYIYLHRRERGRALPVTPYAEGLRAILDGDRARAIQKLRDVVASDTSNVDAYLRLGMLYAELGEVPRSVKILRALTFRADLTTPQKAQVFRALGEAYLKLPDSVRALEVIDHLLSISKKDRWALERKLHLMIAAGEWSKAFDAAQRLAALDGEVTGHFLALLKVQEGLGLCESKKEREGRIQFREAIKYESTFIAPYLYWGDSYIREDRTEDAVKIWRRLLDVNPAKAHLVFERLESRLFDLGRFSEIEQIYRSLIRSYPQSVHAYAALARFLDKRGDHEDAIAVLHEGLHQNPESLWLRRMLIQVYGSLGDAARVLEIGRDVLARVIKAQYEFKCDACGHLVREPLWRCPQCGKLDSFHV